MSQTYEITDGVRRAKAAELAGHDTIWTQVGASTTEQRVPIKSLLSPKDEIDARGLGSERWLSVKRGMSQEPDLLPPIHVVPGTKGAPIHQVKVLGDSV